MPEIVAVHQVCWEYPSPEGLEEMQVQVILVLPELVGMGELVEMEEMEDLVVLVASVAEVAEVAPATVAAAAAAAEIREVILGVGDRL